MNSINSSEQSIKDIKDIMERSATFVSLSGLSGVVSGILALFGVVFLWSIFGSLFVTDEMLNSMLLIEGIKTIIFSIFIFIFIMAILSSFVLTYIKAKKKKQPVFNSSSKRFAFNLFVPILTAVLLIIPLINREQYWLIIPVTLIFFGISLISAGRYSRSEIIEMGIGCILSGLLSLYFTEFSILLWGIGFGVLNILTGISMYYKYDRNK